MPLLRSLRRTWSLNLLWLILVLPCTGQNLGLERVTVGLQADGRIVVPTNQILQPAGRQITFPGRPVDLAWVDEGRTLVVKNQKDLVFIEVASAKVQQTLVSPVGFSVVGLLVRDQVIYVSDCQNHLRIARRKAEGAWEWDAPVELAAPPVGGHVHPAGLAWGPPGKLWVTSTRGNHVQLLNLTTRQVETTVPVGVAPFMVLGVSATRAYVSNWGGDLPPPEAPPVSSSGTPIRHDPRTSVANHGSVSVLELKDGQWKTVKSIAVGLHSSGMALSKNGRFLYVANANSDTISVIDTGKDMVVETIVCRPEGRLPFGSGSNAVALSPDGRTLYVANGTNNCIAVISLAAQSSEAHGPGGPSKSALIGLIPTGWYPGAILLTPDGKQLAVANIKGHGALSEPRPKEKGRNSHDHLGSISLIPVPAPEELARFTEQVNANNRLAYSLAGLERPRPEARPVPVPEGHGESSLFKHVIYIIKENRTYDQILGDMKEGDGAPELVMFGEEVTPNHHALARQFTLFDNFYCSGVLSADGHSWVNEAYVTDYLERSFGGFTRSYPFEGSDPLAFAPTGFLWDNALAGKKTFRNYGEFVGTRCTPAQAIWLDSYEDFKNRTAKVAYATTPNLPSLKPYTHPGYPSFVLSIPDVCRARIFIEDLRKYEQSGDLPNLVYVFLPCDHTAGVSPDFPTPRAMVADNDLALGQVVEAISHSRFWPETCIFVVEDDPQAGFDHVDGHRTVALVISPYTKRKSVDHTNYNQTGMVKTIELILGLPPMNQLDLSATAMRQCFQATPDLTPYACVPNRIPLDEMNPPLKDLKGGALQRAQQSLAMDFSKEDLADEDTLNRILWFATRGDRAPYPKNFAGTKNDERFD